MDLNATASLPCLGGKRAVLFLQSKPLGQNEKNPRTSQEAVQYVSNSHKSELIIYYPAEFKIARENRYV
jgi:hypothetical protein